MSSAKALTANGFGRNDRERRGRLAPSVTVSALLHLVLLAAAILLAHRQIEQPEWSPPVSVPLIFEGGGAKQPEIAAPQPTPAPRPLPESAPSRATPESPPQPEPQPQAAPVPPPPVAVPPQPQTQPRPEQAAPPQPKPAPPPPIPPQARPSPEPEIQAIPLPPPPAPAAPPRPAARPLAPPRPVFPPPMNFSLGRPAAPSSRPAPERLGRGIDLSLGHGVLGAPETKIFGRSDSKEVGPDWFNEFEAWWERHSYYPPQAGENGEQGDVGLDLVIRRNGDVEKVAIVSRSGSQWLDMAAIAVFRNAHLPPLSSEHAEEVPLHLTIHYVIIHR
ncbi:MAG TPA: energy transducer TonB [Acetobacteraceae bacterium]|nr:energy transducer TonB [Acetobacteraceae bacterium]